MQLTANTLLKYCENIFKHNNKKQKKQQTIKKEAVIS